jgi:hypothetical protein
MPGAAQTDAWLPKAARTPEPSSPDAPACRAEPVEFHTT